MPAPAGQPRAGRSCSPRAPGLLFPFPIPQRAAPAAIICLWGGMVMAATVGRRVQRRWAVPWPAASYDQITAIATAGMAAKASGVGETGGKWRCRGGPGKRDGWGGSHPVCIWHRKWGLRRERSQWRQWWQRSEHRHHRHWRGHCRQRLDNWLADSASNGQRGRGRVCYQQRNLWNRDNRSIGKRVFRADRGQPGGGSITLNNAATGGNGGYDSGNGTGGHEQRGKWSGRHSR